MSIKYIFQTLEDRNSDLDKLERNGPYICKWENSWLGTGFYFWDTFIENAHWWGEEIRKYPNGYIICKADCDFNDVECCDLVGNTNHISWLYEAYKLMQEKGLANEKTTVSRLIHHLKIKVKTFNFNAVRAHGFRSKAFSSKFSFNLAFENEKPHYLDLKPAIQICFYSKKSLNLRNYHIVFPEEYMDGYLV